MLATALQRIVITPDILVPANGVLAYLRGPGRNVGAQELLWFDRNGNSRGQAYRASYIVSSVNLSRNGQRIAIDGPSPSEAESYISVIDVARAVPTRLTFGPAYDRTPVWAPDGSRVVFARGVTTIAQLY